MIEKTKAFLGDDVKKELLLKNNSFASVIHSCRAKGLVFDFGPDEWGKIADQNFPDLPGGFTEVFERGINIGNCGATAKRLSYSYVNVNIVTGYLPILKGTPGCPLGGHAWLEDKQFIYDTTLLLKIDKKVKKLLGYRNDVVLTWDDLMNDPCYRERREFVNDRAIKK